MTIAELKVWAKRCLRIYYYCKDSLIRRKINSVLPPTVVAICLSDVCNCQCIMCSVRTQRKLNTDRFMDVDTYRKLIQLLPPTIQIVTPAGLGEIMLHPSFPEIISISKKCFPQIFITTNGTMLSKYIDVCLQIDQIQISLNASNSERYSAIVGKDFFAEVIEGIQALIEAGHKNVQLNFVVQPESLDDIRNFVDLANRLRIKKVNLILRVDTTVWETFSPDLSSELEYGKSKGVTVAVMGKGKGKVCTSPGYCLVVDINFNVQYCCVFPTEPPGSLLKESWDAIWYGPKFSEWRKRVASSEPPLPCVNCP